MGAMCTSQARPISAGLQGLPKRALATAGLLLALWACSPGEASPAPARRVILITCDTLRADRLGTYGYGRGTSPRLDALAEGAAVFEEAYATAPMTQPSVSSLMTGRLPEHVGVIGGNLRRIPSEVETLAERLRSEGIATAAIVSNWVLRRAPKPAGDVGVQQGFEHFDDRMESRELNRAAFERRAPDTTDAALAWLESADASEPFFLWVHYQDPHGPYAPPAGLARKFATDAGDEPELTLGDSVLGRGQLPSYQVLGDERRPSVYRDLYDAEIRAFDRALGRLLGALRERGLLEDALVILTADHGESLGEHDYWFCHGENLHREVVRVPLIVRPPSGSSAPRGRVAQVATLVDVWPTVLEAFGLDPGPTLGRSLLAPLPEGRLVGQSLLPRGKRAKWWAIGDGRWRVVWDDRDPAPRLFDVRDDPFEENDLAAKEPERAQRMIADWAGVVEREATSAAELGTEMGGEGEEDAAEALKFLGYVDGEDG